MYDMEVSPEFIGKATDEGSAEITACQNRPLEPVYPVVFFDTREDPRRNFLYAPPSGWRHTTTLDSKLDQSEIADSTGEPTGPWIALASRAIWEAKPHGQ
jgi:hypothetical protein